MEREKTTRGPAGGLHKFSTRDYIMEPSIFNTLKRYLRKSGCAGKRKLHNRPKDDMYSQRDMMRRVEGFQGPPL